MNKLEILVEEESCEAALRNLLPKLLPPATNCPIRRFRGKSDLLRELPKRLAGYKSSADPNLRLIILLDRDEEDCLKLKKQLEDIVKTSGFKTRTVAGGGTYQVANRIVIEELEAWFFGDANAVAAAYPNLRKKFPNLDKRKEFRNPDNLNNTAETLHKILRQAGYYPNSLPKIETARKISEKMNPSKNTSPSFKLFCTTVAEIITI